MTNKSTYIDPTDCRTCLFCRTEGCCFGCKHFKVIDGLNTCLVYFDREKRYPYCQIHPTEETLPEDCPYKKIKPLEEVIPYG